MGKKLKRLGFMLKFWRLLPFLKDFFLSEEVIWKKKFLGIGLLIIYVVFPFDLIPDFLGIFGLLDDLVIATFVMNRIIHLAPLALKQKYELQV
ncbi:YkvA family protein [Halalkalibacter akibai]|uniref:DUF1232 domain-containing protein n=1 Tax=Halalkalibacter akibai (strain ATCC 43226 / DSM 21942 / CIP 109018 / JCM 9157 / 1139) TaxID=1236973 RepID=W4QRW9_HALA3|nr:DUF1232 domain-containing protein [Halalkalibacter akibai]GAE34845.1 hypothetical protein JCM9157_1925 [Halalkalibacter akibai JCM 9157]